MPGRLRAGLTCGGEAATEGQRGSTSCFQLPNGWLCEGGARLFKELQNEGQKLLATSCQEGDPS